MKEMFDYMWFWFAKELVPFVLLATIGAGLGMVYGLVVVIDRYEHWQKRRRRAAAEKNRDIGKAQ
jgi:hypothetical protein